MSCTRKRAGFSVVSARFSVPAFPSDIRQITARPKLPSNAPAIRVVLAHLVASATAHSRSAVGAKIFLPERILFEYVSAARASDSLLRITNHLAAIRVIFAPVYRFPFAMHHRRNVGNGDDLDIL